MVAISFKLKNGIHHMFQYLGSRDITILRNVADEDYRGSRFFSKFDEFGSTLPNLRNTARRTFDHIGL